MLRSCRLVRSRMKPFRGFDTGSNPVGSIVSKTNELLTAFRALFGFAVGSITVSVSLNLVKTGFEHPRTVVRDNARLAGAAPRLNPVGSISLE